MNSGYVKYECAECFASEELVGVCIVLTLLLPVPHSLSCTLSIQNYRHMISTLIAVLFPFFGLSTPIELDVRVSGRDSDNCLRALRDNPTVVSSFCSAYLTVTT